MNNKTNNTLSHHLVAVKEGQRHFENVFQGVSKMILESDIERVVVNEVRQTKISRSVPPARSTSLACMPKSTVSSLLLKTRPRAAHLRACLKIRRLTSNRHARESGHPGKSTPSGFLLSQE